jgi:hypothetical protein
VTGRWTVWEQKKRRRDVQGFSHSRRADDLAQKVARGRKMVRRLSESSCNVSTKRLASAPLELFGFSVREHLLYYTSCHASKRRSI